MIGKSFVLLITCLFLFSFVEAQKSNPKKSFLLYQFTASKYPEVSADLKNLSDKAYSYGFGITYWKQYRKQLWWSAGYNGTFSNYSPLFVKNDSIGAAKFSSQLDGLLHLFAFNDERLLNLFLSAGIGIGYFPDQFAVYAPLGGGLSVHFKEGARILLQAQYRQPITDGISKHYLHYSFGISQNPPRLKKVKEPTPLPQLPAIVVVTDQDGDGFADSLDLCPNDKGSLKGCPDNDGDLVADKEDLCPDIAGLERYKGCPIPDRDTDGVNDEEDQCPDSNGVAKYKGCPIPDRDGDGINDELDECPDTKGINALKGCPEILTKAKEKVQYAARNILFEFASDKLLQSSLKPLDEVVKIMKEENDLKLSIEAHADNRGTHERNMMWSEKRAKAVADYFMTKGIAEGRLTWKGYGDTQPIADNATEEGRSKNRRVEMRIGY